MSNLSAKLKIIKDYQLSRLSEIVKVVKNCLKCLGPTNGWSKVQTNGLSYKCSKIRRSLSHQVSDSVTRSPIELFWTAKKDNEKDKDNWRTPSKCNLRGLWPLRHLIIVIRRHDLANILIIFDNFWKKLHFLTTFHNFDNS